MKTLELTDELPSFADIAEDPAGVGYGPRPEPNRQLFKNNEAAVDEYLKMVAEGDVLHGQRPPNQAIVHEKPEHFVIVFLKAKGHSNREVAEKTGYTEAWVSQICRQPWFMKKLMQELRTAGRSGVQEFLDSTVEDTLIKLVQLRDGAKTEAVQLAAAVDLANRALGKPIQRTIEIKVPAKGVIDRYESMQHELDELKTRESELEEKLRKAVA